MGTHLKVLGESYAINTNMTGFRWFSKNLWVLLLWTKIASALEGWITCLVRKLMLILFRTEGCPGLEAPCISQGTVVYCFNTTRPSPDSYWQSTLLIQAISYWIIFLYTVWIHLCENPLSQVLTITFIWSLWRFFVSPCILDVFADC